MAFSVDRITSPLILKDSLKTFNKLEFGIRAVATDTVDLELGENYDLPGPPPGGLHGYFRIFNPVRKRLHRAILIIERYRLFMASRLFLLYILFIW
jgi:hypothetical protein